MGGCSSLMSSPQMAAIEKEVVSMLTELLQHDVQLVLARCNALLGPQNGKGLNPHYALQLSNLQGRAAQAQQLDQQFEKPELKRQTN